MIILLQKSKQHNTNNSWNAGLVTKIEKPLIFKCSWQIELHFDECCVKMLET